MRGRSLGFLAAAALSILLRAPRAVAADTEPIRIVFHAPTACPDAEAFTREVQARTTRARLAEPAERARTFTIVVTRDARASRGQLTIDEPGGARSVRTVSAEKCGEIVSALALVTALAIDPRASTAAAPPAPPPAPPAPSPPPPVPRARPSPPPPWAPLPPWGPIGAPLPAAAAPAPPARWRLATGFHVDATSAVAPRLLPVLSGFVELALARDGVLAPSFRLALREAQGGYFAVGPAEARFRWLAARLEGCPARLSPVPSLALFPCAAVDAGALAADGLGRALSEHPTRPWVAPGALGRVQWSLFDRLLLEAEGGVTFPLVRDTFYFAPATTVHQVPVAGGFFGGGVGTHFP